MLWYEILFVAVLAYLIGSFQPSYLLGKAIKKKDIREYGSGNAGSTNAMRVFGVRFGICMLLIDAAKGAFVVAIIKYGFASSDAAIQLFAGIFCIIGHNYPFYMKFKGGKGVAASIGIILVINWRVFLIAGIPALVVLLATRIMSIASLTYEFLSILAFFLVYLTDENFFWIIVTAAFYPLMAFYRHRKNIDRLLRHEETPLWEWKKK